MGNFFRFCPENEKLRFIARRWDYLWCRMWSDRSFQELAEMFHSMKGKTWLWHQDGNSVPYYLLTPVYRQRAINRGAAMKEWDNPQLPPHVTKSYHAPHYIEKDRETIANQQEAKRGTYSLLLTEEDILAANALLRDTRKDAGFAKYMHAASHTDPSRASSRQVPQ